MAKLTLTRLAGGYLSTSAVNANYTLMEAAIENSLSRDGATPNTMSANIDMNSSGRLVNLLDAVNNQEPITLAQAASIAGVTSPLTQDTVAAVLWPQSALETTNGVTATELQYYYGDVRRYGAKLDGATDDTTAFNDAIQSGFGGYCDNGTAAINGTIVITTKTSLTCKAGVTLQRFAGASTEPLIHQYGNLSRFFGGGCEIRQNLYDHPKGIVLYGMDPDHATSGTQSNVQCYNMQFWDAKIIGPENTGPNAPILTGSPGFYWCSAQRKLGTFVGDVLYKSTAGGLQILNCDVLMEFSTDANSNRVIGFYGHQWSKAAIFFNGSYGNLITDIMLESPLAVDETLRFAIHFDEINGGVESDSDLTYTISSASRNVIRGYMELPYVVNKRVAVFTHKEVGSFVGDNEIDITGVTSSGVGIGGASDNTALGTNTYRGPQVRKEKEKVIHINDFVFRRLDDASGSLYGHESWRIAAGRKVAIAESTQEDIFELDNFGANACGVYVKLSYIAKADAISSVQIGEVLWGVWQETAGSRDFRKLKETKSAFDETLIVTPNITLAQGSTGTTTSKLTVGFLTGAPAGTNAYHIGWKAELIGTELEANQDWDDNFAYL
jgi:hypothetical protein